jgi:hypothetical protein
VNDENLELREAEMERQSLQRLPSFGVELASDLAVVGRPLSFLGRGASAQDCVVVIATHPLSAQLTEESEDSERVGALGYQVAGDDDAIAD